jgi:hypothetical protein
MRRCPPGYSSSMIDDQEKHLTETLHRLPNIVLVALCGIAIVSIASGATQQDWMRSARVFHSQSWVY